MVIQVNLEGANAYIILCPLRRNWYTMVISSGSILYLQLVSDKNYFKKSLIFTMIFIMKKLNFYCYLSFTLYSANMLYIHCTLYSDV